MYEWVKMHPCSLPICELPCGVMVMVTSTIANGEQVY